MKHFTNEEFQCSCCGVEEMNDTFLTMLDISRGEAGVPFRITSGYRCRKHNTEVGGATHSAHVPDMQLILLVPVPHTGTR